MVIHLCLGIKRKCWSLALGALFTGINHIPIYLIVVTGFVLVWILDWFIFYVQKSYDGVFVFVKLSSKKLLLCIVIVDLFLDMMMIGWCVSNEFTGIGI